ncbi:MAG TPA: hypothetical protein VGR72_03970 [Candidatus Acidoferrales bacterium]|nr:hypothetical protein [Candidatus Acidoferrales bacterium]
MDKLKAPLSVSVREVVWMGLKEIAERERKKVSEITELILEWSVERLVEVGSTNQLLRCVIRLPNRLRREAGIAKRTIF